MAKPIKGRFEIFFFDRLRRTLKNLLPSNYAPGEVASVEDPVFEISTTLDAYYGIATAETEVFELADVEDAIFDITPSITTVYLVTTEELPI